MEQNQDYLCEAVGCDGVLVRVPTTSNMFMCDVCGLYYYAKLVITQIPHEEQGKIIQQLIDLRKENAVEGVKPAVLTYKIS